MAAETGTRDALCLVVPGELGTATGGYVYDRRMLEELARLGWETQTLSLATSFPQPTAAALEQARSGFDALPDGSRVLIDGLALAGLLPLLPGIVDRLDAAALIHHPLADETGIAADRAAALRSAERAALALVPRIVVTSPWTKRRLADYGVDAGRVTVVEPGVDRVVDRVEPGVVRGAPPAGPTAAGLRLLSVGSLIPRKGHADVIDALARLTALDWVLRCAGSLDRDRRHAAELRERIGHAGLAGRIELLGELSHEALRREYASADLFVLASRLEGYGMALTEAIAHGLPVVSTTAGAIPETVPAAAARLVAPGDVDGLAATLGELLSEAGALAALTAQARAAARTVPGWQAAARRLAAALAGHARR